MLSILTNCTFIHPKMTGFEDGHRTICVLKEIRTIRVNRNEQACFVFEVNSVQYCYVTLQSMPLYDVLIEAILYVYFRRR
jgi:hypothetical protein